MCESAVAKLDKCAGSVGNAARSARSNAGRWLILPWSTMRRPASSVVGFVLMEVHLVRRWAWVPWRRSFSNWNCGIKSSGLLTVAIVITLIFLELPRAISGVSEKMEGMETDGMLADALSTRSRHVFTWN